MAPHPNGDDRPIGVFDSGTGGLTVLDALLRRAAAPDFGGERFIYLGDQANMPYGDYPGEGKEDFLRGLVRNDVRFLLSQDVKIVVIACNTATAYGYGTAEELLRTQGKDIRLIGVVEAGAREAVEACRRGDVKGPFSVGILATSGTVASGVYERTVRDIFAEVGVTDGFHVFSRGCPGLADAVETGDPWAHEIACGYLRALIGEQQARAPEAPLRAVILGCTHFPFVRGALEHRAPAIAFIDPAAATARACRAALAADGRLATGSAEPTIAAYVSVPAPGTPQAYLDSHGWFTRAYKYVRDNPDDGSTRILSMPDALALQALSFPRYLAQLPDLARHFARGTQPTFPLS